MENSDSSVYSLTGIGGSNDFSASRRWKYGLVATVSLLFFLSVRWSLLDNSPPAWDQGLYLYQAEIIFRALKSSGFLGSLIEIFNIDRGRVVLLPTMVQPAFFVFGVSVHSALATINVFWFAIAWSLRGLSIELCGPVRGEKAAFFAFLTFGIYPLTTMLSHNFLVEFPLVAFICVSNYSLWMLCKDGAKKWSLISGVCVGLGLLTKVTFAAFVFPVLVYLLFLKKREKSFSSAIRIFSPSALLALCIATPYYIYNFTNILLQTKSLSSHGLAQLYGFGGAFDIDAVLGYWRPIFLVPAMVLTFFLIGVSVLCWMKQRARRVEDRSEDSRAIIVCLLLWFLIPFFLASFGEIKDARYLYPGLVPLFIVAGASVAKYVHHKLAWIGIALLYTIPLAAYAYGNSTRMASLTDSMHARYGIPDFHAQGADMLPDPRDWKIRDLVHRISEVLGAATEVKTVLFLGGNRYYHLSVMDFTGGADNLKLSYMTLPYYVNPTMTLSEAVKFISERHPDGVLFKTGENWPEFSSRLDKHIVGVFKGARSYDALDLGIEQPDGSRFIMFVKKPEVSAPINSENDVLGVWRAGSGQANISRDRAGGLTVITETGAVATVRIAGGRLEVPSWNLSGNLINDSQGLRWSNGFLWTRGPVDPFSESP